MKLIYGVLILCVISVASCRKDKFSSAPTLTLKSVNIDYVPYPTDGVTPVPLQITLEYSDAEGDLAGMPLCIQKISSMVCPDASRDANFLDTLGDVGGFRIPDELPASRDQKGEIIVTLDRATGLQPVPCVANRDEVEIEDATFKFWLKDQAGNVSDTVTLPIIKIEKK